MKKVLARASILMWIALFSFSLAEDGVTLGGTFVPKERFIVYLGAGHFNMAGRARQDTDSAIHPRCWNFKIDGTITAAWIPAKPVICSLSTETRGNGPWISWLKNMAERYPTYYFGVITNPSGARSLNDDYMVGRPSYTQLMTEAQQWVGKCTFGGVLMMLGAATGDRGDSVAAAAFATNAVAMINGMRTTLQAPYMPFYVNQWECKRDTGIYSYLLPNAQLIIQGMWSIPTLVPYAVTVSNDGLIGTNGGSEVYSNLTLATMTARHIDSMHARGWFPDATPPTATRKVEISNQLQNSSRISIEKSGVNLTNLVISFPGMVKNPSISVFDSKGKLVSGKIGLFTGSQLRYAISGGLDGFYVVKVVHDGGSFVKKVVLTN